MVRALAAGIRRHGHSTYGLELSRVFPRKDSLHGLEILRQPLYPYFARNPILAFKMWLKRRSKELYSTDDYDVELDHYDLTTGIALNKLIQKLRLDVIYAFHNTSIAPLLSGWRFSKRILAINLVGFGIDPSRGGGIDTFPLQRYLFERPNWDSHIAATRFEHEQYRDVYEKLEMDTSGLFYLPHSYDEDLFYPKNGERKLTRIDIDKEAKVLLYPVNVYPRKNIELAIDALYEVNKLFDTHLIVPGSIWDREYHESLLRRASSLRVSDKIHFLQGIPLENLANMYRRADLTINTSHQETFGIGIAESLGCGTPVVGPDWIIPCKEILSESPGGWIAPKNPEGFASVVIEALKSKDDPKRIAEEARLRYGNVSVSKRFLESISWIKANKEKNAEKLRSIDWKALYKDAGDLM